MWRQAVQIQCINGGQLASSAACFREYNKKEVEDLIQNCENVIEEWEFDTISSFLNYIFTILHWILVLS